MKAPFPYMGGKSRIAGEVWSRLGDCPNYVEAFAGSLAMLLARPTEHRGGIETVNDAGWWVWGCCQWIGGGWCAAEGPWRVVDGELLPVGDGTKRKLPHLGNAGRGINRKLPHLGDAGMGMNSVNQDAPRAPSGSCDDWSEHLQGIFAELQNRLRRVRVCCGDWSRVCGPTPTVRQGLTAMFLDPPYSSEDRSDCYAVESRTVAHDVREWAIANGNDPRLRIALCGYASEHAQHMPDGWEAWTWKAHGGYGSQGEGQGRANALRECVWFSPHCLNPQPSLFDHVEVQNAH